MSRIKDIAEALYESTVGRKKDQVDEALKGVVALLARERKISQTDELIRAYEEIYNTREGIVVAQVTSKYPLSDEQNKLLTAFIKKKQPKQSVEIENTVDERLLGGVKIQIGDEVTNMTLDATLEKMHDYLIKNS